MLLWLYPGAIGVKTGFTSPAGFCVVAGAQRGDERLLAVVLGEPGEPFSDAASLLNYGFEAFERRTIQAGESLESVDVGGRSVSVRAGDSLRGLVPVEGTVSKAVVLEDHLAYPPARGEEIGVVRISSGARSWGRCRSSSRASRPTAARTRAWWARAAGAVVDAGDGVLDALFG